MESIGFLNWTWSPSPQVADGVIHLVTSPVYYWCLVWCSQFPLFCPMLGVRLCSVLSLVNGPWITFSASYFSQNLHLPNITQPWWGHHQPISSQLSPSWTNGKSGYWHFPPSRQWRQGPNMPFVFTNFSFQPQHDFGECINLEILTEEQLDRL